MSCIAKPFRPSSRTVEKPQDETESHSAAADFTVEFDHDPWFVENPRTPNATRKFSKIIRFGYKPSNRMKTVAALESAIAAGYGPSVSSIRLNATFPRPMSGASYKPFLNQLVPVLEQFSNLQTLDIAELEVISEFQNLTRVLCGGRSTLVELNLNNVIAEGRITEKMMEVLDNTAEALRDHPTLEKVSFGNPETEHLWDAICSCSQLRSLVVFPKEDSSTFRTILRRLQGHPNLKELSIRKGFSRKCIHAIANFLTTSTGLEKLRLYFDWDLRDRPYETCFLSPLAEALTINRSLKRLILAGDIPVYGEGADGIDFVKMLQDNTVLEEIRTADWSKYKYERFMQEPVGDFYCRLNQEGRRHYLLKSGLATQEEWVDTVLSKKDDTSVVFFLLSADPELVATLT